MTATNLLVERMVIDKLLEVVPSPVVSKNRIGQDLAVLAAVFSLIGSGFLIFAAHLWFRQNYTPDIAMAYTGVLVTVLALILACACMAVEKYKQHKIKEFQSDMHNALHSVIDTIDEVLAEPVNISPHAAIIAASVAGFMAGKRFL